MNILKLLRTPTFIKHNEYNEWERMTASENEWQRVTTNDKEWQRMTNSDSKNNEWQQMTASGTKNVRDTVLFKEWMTVIKHKNRYTTSMDGWLQLELLNK